jgi:hypothetical protein
MPHGFDSSLVRQMTVTATHSASRLDGRFLHNTHEFQ